MATSLLGAAFCIPVGFLLDRFGVRVVLIGVVLTLAVSVLGMARVTGPLGLFITLLLVRGLGQSASLGREYCRRWQVVSPAIGHRDGSLFASVDGRICGEHFVDGRGRPQ